MPGPLGRSVMLPYNARIDLAFEETIVTGFLTPGLVLLHTVPGAYFEILQGIVYTLVTSAVVAARFPRVDIQDADQNVLYSILANGSQPQSTTMRHGLYVDAGTSYFAGATNSVTPLPFVLLQPGYRVFVEWTNVDAGDQMQGSTLSLQRIPTGPEEAATVSAVAPLALT